MKLSNVLLSAGTLTGVPAFFINFSALPDSWQIAWVVAIVACGIAGAGAWAFERRA